MTFNPPRLLAWRTYMMDETGLSAHALGIAGSEAHKAVGTSYHLGEDDLRPDAYSAQSARDRAGLSNAASASDTGNFSRLVELTMWAVGEARAGRRPDTRAIIGPWDDGRAYRFDHLSNWEAELRARGDSHETHMHESWYRDSEHRNKIQYYRPFFVDGGGGDDMSFIGLKDGDRGPRVRSFQAQLRDIAEETGNDAFDPGKIDAIYGPATAAAFLAVRRSVGSSVESGQEVSGWGDSQLRKAYARAFAGGERGPEGPRGEPGKPGKTPTEVTLRLTADVTEVA